MDKFFFERNLRLLWIIIFTFLIVLINQNNHANDLNKTEFNFELHRIN